MIEYEFICLADKLMDMKLDPIPKFVLLKDIYEIAPDTKECQYGLLFMGILKTKYGIADEEKHRVLLKVLNNQGKLNGLVYFIYTTKEGTENFFNWAGLYDLKLLKK